MSRNGHRAIITDEAKIIIFGGYTPEGYTNDILMINILEEKYEKPITTGKRPSSRENFGMVFINNKVFIYGGFQEGGSLNDLYFLDTLTWTWEVLSPQGPLPSLEQGSAVLRVGHKIYVVGGCDFRQKKCTQDTFYFDTDTQWWTKIENK